MDGCLGEIRLFCGKYAPWGWMLCNGQEMQISDFMSLYSILGTSFGGDGHSHFNLPDFRGRIPLGYGQGIGLSQNKIGETSGTEELQLSLENMAPHTHNTKIASPDIMVSLKQKCSTGSGSANCYPGNHYPGPSSSPLYYNTGNADMGQINIELNQTGDCKLELDKTGIGRAFSIMQPSLPITFIINIDGLYPLRGKE